MVGFLFVDEDAFEVVDEIDDAGRDVVRAAHDVLSALTEWSTAAIQEALQAELVETARAQAAGGLRSGADRRHRPEGVAAALRVARAARPRAQPRPRSPGPPGPGSEQPVRRVAAARLRPVHLPAARQHAGRPAGPVVPVESVEYHLIQRTGAWGAQRLVAARRRHAHPAGHRAARRAGRARSRLRHRLPRDRQPTTSRATSNGSSTSTTSRPPVLAYLNLGLASAIPAVDARHVGVPPAAARLARPRWRPGCGGAG